MSDLLLQKANKIVVFDGFNRADNASSLGNADTGQVWEVKGRSTWGIQNGQAYLNAFIDNSIALIDAKNSNFIYKVRIPVVYNVQSCGMAFRAIDYDNQIRIVKTSIDDDNWYLQKRVAGITTSLGGIGIINSGDEVIVIANMDTITIKVNGIISLIVNEAFNITITKSGFTIGYTQGSNFRFDNLSIGGV